MYNPYLALLEYGLFFLLLISHLFVIVFLTRFGFVLCVIAGVDLW